MFCDFLLAWKSWDIQGTPGAFSWSLGWDLPCNCDACAYVKWKMQGLRVGKHCVFPGLGSPPMAMLHFRLQLLWSPFGVQHSYIDLRSAGALPKFDDGFFEYNFSSVYMRFYVFFFQGGLGVITKNWPVHFPDSIFQDYFLDRFSITESGASAFFVTFTIQMLPWQDLKKWDWKWIN